MNATISAAPPMRHKKRLSRADGGMSGGRVRGAGPRWAKGGGAETDGLGTPGGGLLYVSGQPQWGQATARRDNSLPQSEQLISFPVSVLAVVAYVPHVTPLTTIGISFSESVLAVGTANGVGTG